jgi:hypothetical protein
VRVGGQDGAQLAGRFLQPALIVQQRGQFAAQAEVSRIFLEGMAASLNRLAWPAQRPGQLRLQVPFLGGPGVASLADQGKRLFQERTATGSASYRVELRDGGEPGRWAGRQHGLDRFIGRRRTPKQGDDVGKVAVRQLQRPVPARVGLVLLAGKKLLQTG